MLYGATSLGGGKKNFGAVFAFDLATRVLPAIRAFAGGADGAPPDMKLLLSKGALYGTTLIGGRGNCPTAFGQGCGTVFAITP